MTKREAKRVACASAANVLESALGEGWPHNDIAPQLGDERAEREADAVADGVRSIILELNRRARRAPEGT